MASRTYLPQLVFVLKLVCKYMQKWETEIKSHLGGGATEAAFDAALTACQILVPLVEALIPDAT